MGGGSGPHGRMHPHPRHFSVTRDLKIISTSKVPLVVEVRRGNILHSVRENLDLANIPMLGIVQKVLSPRKQKAHKPIYIPATPDVLGADTPIKTVV